MKRVLTFLAVMSVLGMPTQGFAQGSTNPGAGNQGGTEQGGSNQSGNGAGGGSGGGAGANWDSTQMNQYAWGTNLQNLSGTAAPQTSGNQFSHAYAGQAEAGGGGQVQSRFGKKELPADVQTIVQQFQQDRQRLTKQLKTASDDQRKQILRDMEQLRTQMRDRVCELREQCQQQAEQMRNRFRNNRDQILDQGAAGAGPSRDR